MYLFIIIFIFIQNKIRPTLWRWGMFTVRIKGNNSIIRTRSILKKQMYKWERTGSKLRNDESQEEPKKGRTQNPNHFTTFQKCVVVVWCLLIRQRYRCRLVYTYWSTQTYTWLLAEQLQNTNNTQEKKQNDGKSKRQKRFLISTCVFMLNGDWSLVFPSYDKRR